MATTAYVRPDELEDERVFGASHHDTPVCVYRTLKDVARVKSWIGYEELNQTCALGLNLGTDAGRNKIGEYVGAVSEFEVGKKRPMLSAVVVHKRRPREPGYGFYTWADELNQRKHGETDKQLWFRLLGECHAYWSQRPVP